MTQVVLIFYKGISYAIGEEVDLTRLDLPVPHGKVRRAAYVEPCAWPLRVIFQGLRRVFGDQGRVASFTRRWRCRWRVDARPTVNFIAGPFPDRKVALEWERRELVNYLGNLARSEARRLMIR